MRVIEKNKGKKVKELQRRTRARKRKNFKESYGKIGVGGRQKTRRGERAKETKRSRRKRRGRNAHITGEIRKRGRRSSKSMKEAGGN